MAIIAGRRKAQSVVFPTQGDGAMMWKATAVHPLQPMQNVHQRLVRDALGSMTAVDLRDEDKRQAAETAVLERYFVADSVEPALYGEAKNAPPVYVDQDLDVAKQKLKKLVALAAAAVAHAPPADPVPGFQTELNAVVAALETVRAHFTRAEPVLPDNVVRVVPPTLIAIDTVVAAEKAKIAGLTTAAGVDTMAKKLAKDAAKAYDEVLIGFCSIQMMHNIEPFYLFRLMVKFRIDSNNVLLPRIRKEVSGELTGLLNNAQQWTFDWLSAQIKDLDAALKVIDPGAKNLLFFLKGGRALKYLEGDAFAGENDWDTQVVINPELPLDEWYEMLRKVHNVVIAKLKFYKLGFYQLVHQYSAAFHVDLNTPLSVATLPAAVAVPADPAYKMNCKAELIDIGIPRCDTVEAFEQWVQMKGKIETMEGVPLPGFIYYINEYVLMIREAFAETSISIGKTPKRTARLFGILGIDDIAEVATAERGRIPAAAVPKALAAIGTLAADTSKRVFTVLVRQFATGYDLANDPGFAAAFDGVVHAEKGNMATKASYPAALTDAITADKRKADTKWIDADHQPLCDVIGFGNYLSQQCEAHLKARSAFFLKQRKVIGGLIKAVYTASVVNPDEELQIQLAVTGNFAAFLHAHYLGKLTDDPDETSTAKRLGYDAMQDSIIKAFHDKVGLVDVIDVTIYCWKKEYLPDVVLEAVVLPHLHAYAANPKTPLFDIQPGPEGSGSVYVFWPQAEALAPFNYKPVVVRFTVDRHPARWPQLSFIWGYPVLGMRDLINDFHRRCAHVDEFGAQQRLKKTSAALVEMMTHYEYPVSGGHAADAGAPATVLAMPPDRAVATNATIAAITAGTCHHLMISSVQQANGDAGVYPVAMAADRQHLVTLPKPAKASDIKGTLTIAADVSKNRTLDLLVVNQGHGDLNDFAGWSSATLKANVVDPLVAAGVKASTIVLDTCLSASLVSAFAPLCADGGKIYCTAYSTTGLIVTPDVWTSIDGELTARDVPAIRAKLVARMTWLSRDATAFVNVPALQVPGAPGSIYASDVVGTRAGARDRISIVRYLPQIAAALDMDDDALPAAYWPALNEVKGLPLLGDAETWVLGSLTPTARMFGFPQLDGVKREFRKRVVDILTNPTYGISLAPGTLTDKSNVGRDSVWTELASRLRTVLHGVAGFAICPTCFAAYDPATKKLDVDSLLTADLPPRNKKFVDAIFPNSSAELAPMRAALAKDSITLDPKANYLQ
ncbi:MAG: hypothetical protein JWM41_3699 [Gemmatimonadetes bacterium]|nr:hypothetical protein [Gemmatimonadota bacterium]